MQVIVFVMRKVRASALTVELSFKGVDLQSIHGDRYTLYSSGTQCCGAGRNRLEGPAVAPAQMKKKTFFLRHNIG